MYLNRDGSARGYARGRLRAAPPPGLGSFWGDIGKLLAPVVGVAKQAGKEAVQKVIGAAKVSGAQQIAATPEGQAELRRQALTQMTPYLLAAGALVVFLLMRPGRR